MDIDKARAILERWLVMGIISWGPYSEMIAALGGDANDGMEARRRV